MGQHEENADARSVERRTSQRIGVDFWVEEQCGAGVYFHRVTNLSRGGFFVEKRLPFKVGQTVRLRLDLPGAPSKLEARSRVINNYRDLQANLKGAGFQFLDLDARTRAGLEDFMRRTGRPEE
jgi:Tfp pilus assembly protein PilZ